MLRECTEIVGAFQFVEITNKIVKVLNLFLPYFNNDYC